MRNIATLLLLFLFCFTARGQQQVIRLIVRGDDMGYFHSGNQALIFTSKKVKSFITRKGIWLISYKELLLAGQ